MVTNEAVNTTVLLTQLYDCQQRAFSYLWRHSYSTYISLLCIRYPSRYQTLRTALQRYPSSPCSSDGAHSTEQISPTCIDVGHSSANHIPSLTFTIHIQEKHTTSPRSSKEAVKRIHTPTPLPPRTTQPLSSPSSPCASTSCPSPPCPASKPSPSLRHSHRRLTLTSATPPQAQAYTTQSTAYKYRSVPIPVPLDLPVLPSTRNMMTVNPNGSLLTFVGIEELCTGETEAKRNLPNI